MKLLKIVDYSCAYVNGETVWINPHWVVSVKTIASDEKACTKISMKPPCKPDYYLVVESPEQIASLISGLR